MPRTAHLLLPILLLLACQLPIRRTGEVPMPRPEPEPVSSSEIAAIERDVIRVVNGVRDSYDARPLQSNDAMTRAARGHARELAQRGVLDHASSTPGRETFAKRLGAEGAPAFTLAGENLIQLPYIARDVADEAVKSWLGSPSHRAQLLEPTFTDTGVGIARANNGDWYIVQLFIRRR